jgi:hypothetical protein
MLKIQVICLYLVISTAGLAQNLSKMYSASELQYWQTRYPENIRWNFQNLILDKLTPAEYKTLGRVNIECPIFGAGEAKKSPLTYYSSGRTITVPIFSIKFFDDICISYAWLDENNFTLMTISEYLVMLKYRHEDDFPNSTFPSPLSALQIPENALSNSRVDQISQNMLKSAIVFILAHELGHIYHNHPRYNSISSSTAQRNELQADTFAMEIMRRIGIAPVGIVNFAMMMFQLGLIREDFRDAAKWQNYLQNSATHPITSDRLYLVSQVLRRNAMDFTRYEPDRRLGVQRILNIADQIDQIAAVMADLTHQKNILQRALAYDLTHLAPRRVDVPPISSLSSSRQNFDGNYKGTWQQFDTDGKRVYSKLYLTLNRNNGNVNGSMSLGLGVGDITGLVIGNKFRFSWQWSTAFGKGILTVSDNQGRLEGSCGYDQDNEGAGIWRLTR